MSITQSAFEKLPDGREVISYTITNSTGANLTILNLGGIIHSIYVFDRAGNPVNIALGCDDAATYFGNGAYIGALIGRYANRIAKGRFMLDGREIDLNCNNGQNHLHGGLEGFDKKIWDVKILPCDALELTYFSPDGEENYPGNLKIRVIYKWTDDCELKISYEATTDSKTICNLTNHAYFNLSGHDAGSIADHLISINADYFTPIDDECIPTGEIRPVKNTPLDLRRETRIGDGLAMQGFDEQLQFGNGYDHNYVLPDGSEPCATVYAPETGIEMKVFTDQAGVQFYSGNWLESTGTGGAHYSPRSGFCLETQAFPDSPNHINFTSVELSACETYSTNTSYVFSAKHN